MPSSQAVIRYLDLDSSEALPTILGALDRNLSMIGATFGVSLSCRGSRITAQSPSGEAGSRALIAVSTLHHLVQLGHRGSSHDLTEAIRIAQAVPSPELCAHLQRLSPISSEIPTPHDTPNPDHRPTHTPRSPTPRSFSVNWPTTQRHSAIRPRSPGQRLLLDAMETHTITLALGSAGTGKTYLAVNHALALLKSGQVRRIVISRPVVEAGEKLGFLPGDIRDKIDPYLRPVMDVLHESLGSESTSRRLDRAEIEIAPLAYMRGRTLKQACVILDEGQNATVEQLKMFLTRLGESSRMIVTGDPTQSDLRAPMTSGLRPVADLLRNIQDIAIVEMKPLDIVRHPLVETIVKAFAESDLGTQPTRLSRAASQ